ncbi:MAG: formylmethanofuran dehydrogenase subunit C [Isosphaeraceae bacterium]
MSLSLTWLDATTLPVDGSALCPEGFRDRTADEARQVRLRLGNTSVDLAELFRVEGGRGDDRLAIDGDLRHVHGLGRGMTTGHLEVRGDAGPLLGAEMSGGHIEVEGAVGDWAGAELRGGTLRIRGRAGDFLGAAHPGSRAGMREGVILVEGNVGDDSGLLMRRGLIAIRGRCGDGLGRSMIAGTILALGPVGARTGAGMKRGTLVLPGLDRAPGEALLPSFAPAGRFPAPFLALYYRQLDAWGFAIPRAVSSALLDRYNGDLVVDGHGEVLAATPHE